MASYIMFGGGDVFFVSLGGASRGALSVVINSNF